MVLWAVAAIKTTHKGIDSSAYQSQKHFKTVHGLEKCQNTLEKKEMDFGVIMLIYFHM